MAAKVNPGRGTGGWRSRGAQRVVRKVGVSVVLDAGTEMEVINRLDDGLR